LHALRTQVTSALATGAHGRLQPPQWLAFELRSTHCAPQSVGAVAEHPVVQPKAPPMGEQMGFVVGQTALQLPQCAGSERSVSQPSPGCWLQSA
jgi:hypothetical protein